MSLVKKPLYILIHYLDLNKPEEYAGVYLSEDEALNDLCEMLEGELDGLEDEDREYDEDKSQVIFGENVKRYEYKDLNDYYEIIKVQPQI